MTYAFRFDASACSGCKACQIACKDKNNLPPGVLWRRVYEISGGSWQKQGNAWITDVFAYNISVACNHCIHPKCAGVCPTNAYVIREDGIVLLDSSKCMGCGYCGWACPYSVPQYNDETGYMSKCDFCYDNIEQNLPPACVAACPLRVLEYEEISEQSPVIRKSVTSKSVSNIQELWKVPGTEHPYPLPKYSRTEPHVAIKPHAAMWNGLERAVANREEIRPRLKRSKISLPWWPVEGRFWTTKSSRSTLMGPDFGSDELPLIAFTLLAQLAVGVAVFAAPLTDTSLSLWLVIGFALGFAGLFSFLHLGLPFKAWRALSNLNKSWLSREILMTGLFGSSWLLTLILPNPGKWIMVLTGIGLIHSMAQVYRLKSAPGWNTWRTPVSFFLAGGILGTVTTNFWSNNFLLLWIAALLLFGESVILPEAHPTYKTARQTRLSLIRAGIFAALITPFLPESLKMWANIPICFIVFIEEILGRWLFYESREN